MIRLSELHAFVNTEDNQVITESPINEFFGASCQLLGKVLASDYGVKHVDYLFVHSFNPSDFQKGTLIEHTNLEWISYSEPTQDLSCKAWSAIAFDRNQNKIVSGKGWSVWASDRGVRERWLSSLQNKYSTVPLIS